MSNYIQIKIKNGSRRINLDTVPLIDHVTVVKKIREGDKKIKKTVKQYCLLFPCFTSAGSSLHEVYHFLEGSANYNRIDKFYNKSRKLNKVKLEKLKDDVVKN